MTSLFIVGRVVLATYFLMMGINHFKNRAALVGYAQSRKLPMPRVGVAVSGVMIILGALGVLLGIYTKVAIGLLVVFLVAAAFGIHHYWTDTDPMARMGEMTNFMKNIALAAALLMTLLVPEPWPFSL